MNANTRCTYPMYVCASETTKLIGTLDGWFPDFGHHLEKEMGGLWLHPIKVLDGFWLRLVDHSCENIDVWTKADGFENLPWGNCMQYRGGLGHTTVDITRTQVAPENAQGIVVTYALHNRDDKEHQIELEFLARTDLRPVWFSEEIGLKPGFSESAEWIETERAMISTDSENPWCAVVGCSEAPESVRTGGDLFGPEVTAGKGTGLSMSLEFELGSGETKTVSFYLTGSMNGRADALERLNALKTGEDFIAAKQARYDALLKRSQLTTGDTRFDEIYDWVKVNTDWLIQRTDSGERGLTAGIPEYPWWFGCDNSYSLQGVLAMGDFELCRDTLELILSHSERVNGNGRIVHEITTAGACVNPGNTQETAHFVLALWDYYRWTGDRAFIERALPYVRKSIDWLEAQDEDGDLFPSGYGIIEIAGLNAEMIDTAVYTAQAYECFANMLTLLGETENAQTYFDLSKRTCDAINTLLWDEEQGLYCDTFTSVDDVRQKREQILSRVPGRENKKAEAFMDALLEKKAAQGEDESGWIINRNWIINTPMETGIAPKDQAERALLNMHTDEFIGPNGMYLNALHKSDTMTISTGVMAVAQARYGHSDRALSLIQKIFGTFGRATPGSISEMSPDYGCFVQAWTVYGVLVTITEHFFGIHPEAHKNRVMLKPCLPTAWTTASIERVRMPDGELTIKLSRQSDELHIEGTYTGTMKLMLSTPEGNPTPIPLNESGAFTAALTS